MGIKLFSSDRYPPASPYSCVPCCDSQPKIYSPGNPDPAHYDIVDTLTIGDYLIVEIRYPNCKNYEGKKIMVYEGINWATLRSQKLIDPHFSEHPKFKSPIARFEPTDKGWRMAETFAKAMMEKKK